MGSRWILLVGRQPSVDRKPRTHNHLRHMAINDTPNPLISPDGQFEVTVEETIDRFDRLYDTILLERATGERPFACQGSPPATFSADGTLTILYPGYEPGGVQIDPIRRTFRLRSDYAWLPLAAWPHLQSAFGRGWSQAMEYKSKESQLVFPWTEILLLIACFVALPVITVLPIPSENVRIVLLLVAGLGICFFGWLLSIGLRSQAWAKKQARTVDAARRSRPNQLTDRN
jgi:hypothetical protein